MASTLAGWADRLQSLVEKALEASVPMTVEASGRFVDRFRDNLGHRRPEDGPFLRTHLGLEPLPDTPPPPNPAPTEARLWALAGGSPADSPDRLIGRAEGEGPLLLGHDRRAIEVASDAELCAIHALWAIGERHAAWRDRALAAARWCVDELQPDNATNEPWAIHVFLILEHLDRDAAAGLYAQTLLHNAMVAGAGSPTGGASSDAMPTRSAWIIRDAAMRLRREADRDARA